MAAAGVIEDFELPAELEAAEPPEARGLRRDEVRLLVSDLERDSIDHARFNELLAMAVAGRSARRQHERHAERARRGCVCRRIRLRDSSCRPGCLGDSGASKYGDAGVAGAASLPFMDVRAGMSLAAAGRRRDHAARAVSAQVDERTIALVDRGARTSGALWPRISTSMAYRFGTAT